jgi:uncharacterized secreted protein with C-terminal beta-propeller domain
MTTKKTTRTRAEAKKLMWEYYSENKASLPTWIRECREDVIEDLINGLSAETVFSKIIESVELDADDQQAA